MLTPPPDISIDAVAACLADAYGVRPTDITFLPLGADANTAVYRFDAGGQRYFLKLRGGEFDGRSVVLPRFLHDQGITAVIAPIATRDGALSAACGRFSAVLSPYVEGANGFASPLTDAQWVELGRTLAAMHALRLPSDVEQCVPRETWTARWRDDVRRALDAANPRADAAGVALDDLLRERRSEILHLVERASRLAEVLQTRPHPFVLCHGDIHAGNVLIDGGGRLHVVDWDDAWLAPKERDLMFIGAGIGRAWNEPREAALFYEGYGDAPVDEVVLAYYRYERIVQDFASYVSEIREHRVSDEDALKGAGKLASAFGANDVIEIARRADHLAA
jgi:spectinomycin phosphotransferase